MDFEQKVAKQAKGDFGERNGFHITDFASMAGFCSNALRFEAPHGRLARPDDRGVARLAVWRSF